VPKPEPFNPCAIPNLGHLQFRRGAVAEAAATFQQVLQLAKFRGAGIIRKSNQLTRK
jgi:hypothetical protein